MYPQSRRLVAHTLTAPLDLLWRIGLRYEANYSSYRKQNERICAEHRDFSPPMRLLARRNKYRTSVLLQLCACTIAPLVMPTPTSLEGNIRLSSAAVEDTQPLAKAPVIYRGLIAPSSPDILGCYWFSRPLLPPPAESSGLHPRSQVPHMGRKRPTATHGGFCRETRCCEFYGWSGLRGRTTSLAAAAISSASLTAEELRHTCVWCLSAERRDLRSVINNRKRRYIRPEVDPPYVTRIKSVSVKISPGGGERPPHTPPPPPPPDSSQVLLIAAGG